MLHSEVHTMATICMTQDTQCVHEVYVTLSEYTTMSKTVQKSVRLSGHKPYVALSGYIVWAQNVCHPVRVHNVVMNCM